jgi:rare lipoprotein A
VHVTNLVTGRTVDVVVRDRGPFADPARIIDLSPTAFSQIAPLGSGIVPVKIEW